MRALTEQEFRVMVDRMSVNSGVPAHPPAPSTSKRRGNTNKLEARFLAEVIQPRIDRGEVAWADFECFKFRLADGAWYTADVPVIEVGIGLVVFEVKGFWREAARVRIKVAADKYPFRFVAVTRDRRTGEWKFEEIPGRAARRIA